MSQDLPRLTTYERSALAEIDRFKNEEPGMFERIAERIGKPAEWIADKALDSAVGEALGKVVQGLISLLNDGASWSVREATIFEEFRARGHAHVEKPDHIRALSLEELDRTVGMLDTKYKALALAEGAGTGLFGGAALALAIPALVGIALRAVGEYATYYGFDVGSRSERAFALRILGAASSPTRAARRDEINEITHLSRLVAGKQALDQAQGLLSGQAIRSVAEMLGLRLTKAKLAQVVPVAGAVIGGGYNAWYIGEVTEAAYHLYRERFLVERHGPEIAVAVRGAHPAA